MIKINKHIEIVRSSVASLSSMGKKSCDMIQTTLEQHYEHVGVSVISDESDLRRLVAKQPDLVFLGVKYMLPDESSAANIWVAEYLDRYDVNYTGSNASAIALDFNKPAAKQTVKSAQLNTAAYFIAMPGQYLNAEDLPLSFPLFIKPPNAGGGKGVGADSVVRDFASFEQKVQSIAQNFNIPSLVETYLPGREFSVAIMETSNTEELLAMPIELIAERNDHGDRVLGQKIKSDDTERVIAVLDTDVKKVIQELAVNVFRALGARDYGRIDIRLDELGVPHFLEANLIPGLALHDFTSYFTHACWINEGLNYESMILAITRLSLNRPSAGVPDFIDLEPLDRTMLPVSDGAFNFV